MQVADSGARSPHRRLCRRAGRARTARNLPQAGPPSERIFYTGQGTTVPCPATVEAEDVLWGVMDVTERLFERMVHEPQDRVFAFSLALTGNRHDAEEVAQDTFLKAYRALVTYPPDRIRELKQKPWLHRIALNVVRNRARGTRPRLVELNGSEPDHALGPEDGALLKIEMDALAQRVACLPARYRGAVVLRPVQELSDD